MPEKKEKDIKRYEKKTMQSLNRLEPEEFHSVEKINLSLILDNIRSLQNVGSIFRTSDAFNLKCIYLCGITGTPPNKDIEKSALGATTTVKWIYKEKIKELIEELIEQDYKIYALEQTENSSNMLNFEYSFDHDTAIILGNEVFGVSDEALKLVHGTIEIPQFGTKHSLNVAVSTGMLVLDFYSKIIGNTSVKPS